MKRSPLNRRTPIKRTKLQPVSAKKRQEKRDTDAQRAKYVKSKWLCECCCKRQAVSCHEIASGGSRCVAVYARSCYLALCEDDPSTGRLGCHGIVQYWPLVKQLALKKSSDPKGYDRAEVLRIKRLGKNAITENEVDECLRQMNASA